MEVVIFSDKSKTPKLRRGGKRSPMNKFKNDFIFFATRSIIKTHMIYMVKGLRTWNIS